MNREQLIQARAYALWEAEGCPHGREEQHWQQATIEVDEAAITPDVYPAEAEETKAPDPPSKPAAKRTRAKAAPAIATKPRTRGKAKA